PEDPTPHPPPKRGGEASPCPFPRRGGGWGGRARDSSPPSRFRKGAGGVGLFPLPPSPLRCPRRPGQHPPPRRPPPPPPRHRPEQRQGDIAGRGRHARQRRTLGPAARRCLEQRRPHRPHPQRR